MTDIDNKIQQVKNRMREIEIATAPTAKRIAIFGAAGMLVGGIWAWTTKQKTLTKIGAVIGGGICANLISSALISDKKASDVVEYKRLEQELRDLNSQKLRLSLTSSVQR